MNTETFKPGDEVVSLRSHYDIPAEVVCTFFDEEGVLRYVLREEYFRPVVVSPRFVRAKPLPGSPRFRVGDTVCREQTDSFNYGVVEEVHALSATSVPMYVVKFETGVTDFNVLEYTLKRDFSVSLTLLDLDLDENDETALAPAVAIP